MTIRSMKWAASVSLFAAVLAVGTTLPERQAAAQVQAVPRAGLAFNDTITQRVTIESVDPEGRTVVFTLPDGQLVAAPVAGSVSNLAAIQDGSVANVTYDQVVTILNLRQKGPGSKEERRESMGKPSAADIDSGRFTVTVVGVDLANNTVSVIDGIGTAPPSRCTWRSRCMRLSRRRWPAAASSTPTRPTRPPSRKC